MFSNSESNDILFRKPSWWNHRSSVEKNIIISIILLLIMTIVLSIVIILIIHRSLENAKLYTKSNVESTAIILNYMNKDVDPCDDFYEFACGTFLKKTIIPLDKYSKNSFEDRDETILFQLFDLFEQPEKPDDPRCFNLVKKYYRACLNETVLEQRGVQPIIDLLYELGSFPILERKNWNENNFEWINMMKKIRQLGFDDDYLVKFHIINDYKNISKHMLQLDKIEWSLDIVDHYLELDIENEKLQNYYKFMLDAFEYLNLNKTEIKGEVREVLEFMRSLALISTDELNTAAERYNPITIGELQNKHPNINWIEYINNILDTSIKFTSKEVVNIKDPQFIAKFEELMNSTPKKVIANYLGWRSFRTLISGGPKDLKQRQSEQIRSIKGIRDLPLRWKSCVNRAHFYIDVAASALYVRKYFDKEIKDQIKNITNYIKAAIIDLLKFNKWMDDDTRNYAIEKIENADIFIAHPDELLNDTIIDDFYKTLELNEALYLELRLNLTKFLNDKKYGTLFLPANKYNWVDYSEAAETNVAYSERKNSIEVIAGILNGLFFGKNRPKYLNYGAIGTLIGYSFALAITSEGRKYDKNGALNNWWTKETDEEFFKKSECFVEQYNNYTIPIINEKINGRETRTINIGDFGAIQITYAGYLKWLQDNREEKLLPAVPYTPRQLFWISRAQIFCSQERYQGLEYITHTYSHTPKRFRVNGPLANSPEFSRDFDCPIDSNMNPKHKCTLF